MTRILAWVLLLASAGCSVGSRIDAQQDPAFNISKVDPVYLATPDDPTIYDRQIFALLRAELPREGFTVVDAAALARWGVVGSVNDDNWMRIAHMAYQKSRIDYRKKTLVVIAAFPAMDFMGGKRSAAWSGMSYEKNDIYRDYPHAVVKIIDNHFGQNFEDGDSVSRSYEHQQ